MFEEKEGKIIEKEGASLIAIREATDKDLDAIANILKTSYEKHNIFNQDEKAVLEYVKNKQKATAGYEHGYGGGFIIALADDKPVGTLLLECKDIGASLHLRWKLKHLAVLPEFRGKEIGKDLVEDALSKIKTKVDSKQINSAKVVVSAVNEKLAELARSLGFKQEGVLENHYRLNETTYLLAKTFIGA